MNKHSTARAPFCTGKGQSDTHAITLSDGRKNTHPSAGKPYDIIRFEAIVSMVENPPSVPKDQAQWIIPSAYTGHDARTHDVQRQRGLFRLLPLDVDEGNLPLQDLLDAVQAVAGPCAYVAYSTRGAEPDLLKWRVLIPLAQPIEGVDYAAFVEAFNDLLIEQTGGKLIPDRKLQGAGQLIYLPNKGDHYEYHINLDAQPLDPVGPNAITTQRDKTVLARSAAEKAAKSRAEHKAAERRAKGSEEASPVDHFNEVHSIADLLEKYGYTRNGQSNDYRSPMQTSRSYATQARDGHWISLSGSDDNAGIGASDKNGNRFGDAFDLFVYFEHGGNFEEAVRAYSEEAGLQGQGFDPDLHKVFGRQRVGSDSHQEGAGEAQDGAEQQDDPGDGPQHPSVSWEAPLRSLIAPQRPEAPPLPLADVCGPKLARWIEGAAAAKGAPADYVLATLLAASGSLIGNARWVSAWNGWSEPPVLWVMDIGLPSSGKSPAIDAVLHPVREIEKPLRDAAQLDLKRWRQKEEGAKLVNSVWKEQVKAAIKDGKEPPGKPAAAEITAEPHIPRLVINDGTIERIAMIASRQPKGVLQARDELSGWLTGMTRYSGGSTDRPFWLEAWGGRTYSVERMGRDPLTVDRLAIGVVGGIQPDRLGSLLLKTDDDGLLARFIPIWPERVAPKRPGPWPEEPQMQQALTRLHRLNPIEDEDGALRPWFISLTDEAKALMDDFRIDVQGWEDDAAGLLLSFVGKLPGLAARIALVLGYLDWAIGEDGAGDEPQEVDGNAFGRACHLIETYLLPMAARAYAGASAPKEIMIVRRLADLIRRNDLDGFTARDIQRLGAPGLTTASEVKAALKVMIEGGWLNSRETPTSKAGGRRTIRYDVNPEFWGLK